MLFRCRQKRHRQMKSIKLVGLPKASLLFAELVLKANEDLLGAANPILDVVYDELVLDAVRVVHIVRAARAIRSSSQCWWRR